MSLLLLFAGCGTSVIPPPPPPPKKVVGWADEDRRRLRNSIKPKQLDKIFAAHRSAPREVNRAYDKIQSVIDDIESMTPLELATEELLWRIGQRDECLMAFKETGENRFRLRAEGLERRINELYTEIYRLKLIADLEQKKH